MSRGDEIEFFFQAEDGIRGRLVTGVQTCALPIYEALFALGRSQGEAARLQLARRLATVEGRAKAERDRKSVA